MFPLVPLLARHQWFTHDDWDFVASRSAGSFHDLMRSHNGHWSTLPILAYRLLFHIFGLKHYWPYQLAAVFVHVATAVLLRVLMRRIGVGAWVATGVASLFACFGAGWQDIIWGFQIGFVGALFFGLAQLILSDHEGRIDRRDWFALGCGMLGLLCSSVAVTMVVIVGAVALARRGWRIALFHTVPLGVIYAVWYVTLAGKPGKARSAAGHLGLLLKWILYAIQGMLDALGHFRIAGIILGVVLTVGLWIAWRPLGRGFLRSRAVIPAALLVGAFGFTVIVGWGRVVSYQPVYGRASRYVDIATGMALPAVAVGVDTVIRRWRRTAPLFAALLIATVPGNVNSFHHPSPLFRATFQIRYRQSLLALAFVPAADEVPRTLKPDRILDLVPPGKQFAISLGWLLDQKAQGRLPNLHLGTQAKADATIGLALHQSAEPGLDSACHALDAPATITLAKNNSIAFDKGRIDVRARYPAGGIATYSTLHKYDPAEGKVLTALLGALTLKVSSDPHGPTINVCSHVRLDNRTKADIFLHLSLPQSTRASTVRPCRVVTAPVDRNLSKGQTLGIRGGPLGVVLVTATGSSHVNTYKPADGPTLTAAGALHLRLSSRDKARPATICG
jgi:MFS family permease